MEKCVELLNNLDNLVKVANSSIEAIGDCPNVERPAAADLLFWKTIDKNGGYECQENVAFGICRVVSPKNIRVANGSKLAMLEKMKRLARKDFFAPGDVVGVSRNGLYEHYAIYLGNDRVIHYSGEGDDFNGSITVHEAPFSDFIKDSEDCFVVWFDGGRPIKLHKQTTFLFTKPGELHNAQFQQCKGKVFSAEETVKRAKQRLGEKRYNLLTNNCEHFAMWCKTGVSESLQVKRIIGGLDSSNM